MKNKIKKINKEKWCKKVNLIKGNNVNVWFS